MHKYLAFFKKVLTGTIGKNLMNLEFHLAEETEGGKQEFLLKLRDSELDDDELVDSSMTRSSSTMIIPRNTASFLSTQFMTFPNRNR